MQALMQKLHTPIITRKRLVELIPTFIVTTLFSLALTSSVKALTAEDEAKLREAADTICKFSKDATCADSVVGGKVPTALGYIPYETGAFVPALLTFLIGIAGGAALILMIVGAGLVLTGGSNPEQVKRGKEVFMGALTGLLFIIFSAVALRIIAGDIIKLPGFT